MILGLGQIHDFIYISVSDPDMDPGGTGCFGQVGSGSGRIPDPDPDPECEEKRSFFFKFNIFFNFDAALT